MDRTLDKAPLRFPGQSLQEHLSEHGDEAVARFAYVGGIFVGILLASIMPLVSPFAANPWVMIPTAAVAAVVVGTMTVRRLRSLRTYRLGLRGEQLVGEALHQGICDNETFVFHDLTFPGFNIDHVVIGTRGIFALETKAVYNDTDQESQKQITVTGDEVRINDVINRDHIPQALRQAETLKKLLVELGFPSVFVEAGLIYPGRWVESRHERVLVRNATAFCTSYRKREPRLDLALVRQIRSALDRHQRGSHAAGTFAP